MVWRRPYFFGTSKSVTVPRLVAADLDHQDDEVGPIQAAASVGAGEYRRRRIAGVGQPACHALRHRETIFVDVVQRYGACHQRRRLKHVGDDVAHEHGAARTVNGDVRQALSFHGTEGREEQLSASAGHGLVPRLATVPET